LKAGKEELEQHCSKQSQLLVEARQKARQKQEKDSKEIESLRAELEASNAETKRLKEHEQTVEYKL
jgi:hypothetical protein